MHRDTRATAFNLEFKHRKGQTLAGMTKIGLTKIANVFEEQINGIYGSPIALQPLLLLCIPLSSAQDRNGISMSLYNSSNSNYH